MRGMSSHSAYLVVVAVLLLPACTPEDSEASKCADSAEKINALKKCPVGSFPSGGVSANNRCEGQASYSYIEEAGDIKGVCISEGSCSFACLSTCTNVLYITETEVVCETEGGIACRPGTRRCSGDTREECRLDGASWETVPCPTDEVCVDEGECRVPCPDNTTMKRLESGECVCRDPNHIVSEDGLSCGPCIPTCEEEGLQCGKDSRCQKSCGTCSTGTECVAGGCQTCEPNACGGTCGSCQTGSKCLSGQCVPCGCGSATCGADPCGNSCGACSSNADCIGGQCQVRLGTTCCTAGLPCQITNGSFPLGSYCECIDGAGYRYPGSVCQP